MKRILRPPLFLLNPFSSEVTGPAWLVRFRKRFLFLIAFLFVFVDRAHVAVSQQRRPECFSLHGSLPWEESQS